MDGTPFGRYRLIELIGQGSVGEVYRAFDDDTRREVAVKVLSAHVAADETFRERFRREALVTAKLQDPHVIPIHAFGEIDGRLFLDMRLIDGADLRMHIHTQIDGIPARSAVSYVEQVASALDTAHAHGLLHRDVKPSNMLVSVRDFVYLIDFGIARGVTDSSLTTVGTTVGTMAYMAPERFGNDGAGPSSDIYSLTCVLYECLTGQPPFPGRTLEQQVAAHLTAEPPQPSQVRPQLPADFDAVIARGMAKRPDDRFATAGELAAAARRALGSEPTDAEAPVRLVSGRAENADRSTFPEAGMSARTIPTAPETTDNHRRRRGLVVVGALAVVMATAAATGAAILQNDQQTPTRAAATDVATTTTSAAPPTTTAPPSTTTTEPVGPPSFERMDTFVRDYYNLLPAQPDRAWDDLGAAYAASAGRSGFDSFWATIDTVTVTSVRPSDASSVVVGLTYRTRSGATDSENRWVSVEVDDDGTLRIADSNRL